VTATAAGVLSLATTLIGLTRRTLWLDESATVSASTRSWDQMHALLERIDLVHGAYYAVMHVWFSVVGYSPLALRFPSAVAVALSAALVVVLGQRLSDLRVGAVSALVFVLVPPVAFAATNGRSQGFEILLAVGSTLLLVHALDTSSTEHRRLRAVLLWVGYGLVAYLGVLVFLWFALVVAAHALTVLVWFLRAPARRWPGLVGGAASVVVVVVTAVPFARAAAGQAAQVGWLTEPTLRQAVQSALRVQFFDPQMVIVSLLVSTVLAVLAWVLVTVGGVAAVRARSEALVFLLPWLILPTVVLLAVSRYVKPIYAERYVSFSTPALALLVGAGLVALLPLLRGAVSVVLLAAFVTTAGVIWIDVRWGTPVTTDFRPAAIAIEQGREHDAEPAGLLLGTMHRPADQLTIDYPEATDGLRNLSVTKPAVDVPYFFADLRAPADALSATQGLRTVWYIGDDAAERTSIEQAFAQRGFRSAERLEDPSVFVIEFTR
jgi:mannosyltransferase